jgi:hypothetical protein
MTLGLREIDTEQAMIKTAFLSYYISMYNSVNQEIGYEDAPVTVDEIFDFIQDMKQYGKHTPDICRDDISYCFHVLQVSGVCTKQIRQSNF